MSYEDNGDIELFSIDNNTDPKGFAEAVSFMGELDGGYQVEYGRIQESEDSPDEK